MRHRAVTYSGKQPFSALADPTRRAVLDFLEPARVLRERLPALFLYPVRQFLST